jgi:hypothetical protein
MLVPMRGVLAILIALTVALAPLHAATAALCVEDAPTPATQADACCPTDAGDASPERPTPPEAPCEDGCDCALACCGVLAQTVAPPMHFDIAPRITPAIALGAALDDAPPPDRRPAGLRRPPRLGLQR